MLSLKADIRKEKGKKTETLRKEGLLPAVLYGPGAKSIDLKVEQKAFRVAYKEAGESSLLTLELTEGSSPVLIKGVQVHPLSGEAIHVDFYQPRLDQELRMNIPVELEGEAPAVRDLFGTLIQNVHEVEVSALPVNLPREIVVNVDMLKTFEDKILVKDLKVGDNVKILAGEDWVIAQVVPPEDVEKELEAPVKENVEDVEKVETKKPAEEADAEGAGEKTGEKKAGKK